MLFDIEATLSNTQGFRVWKALDVQNKTAKRISIGEALEKWRQRCILYDGVCKMWNIVKLFQEKWCHNMPRSNPSTKHLGNLSSETTRDYVRLRARRRCWSGAFSCQPWSQPWSMVRKVKKVRKVREVKISTMHRMMQRMMHRMHLFGRSSNTLPVSDDIQHFEHPYCIHIPTFTSFYIHFKSISYIHFTCCPWPSCFCWERGLTSQVFVVQK